ncbi:sigma-70 family RNA polymerase sigma factor [Chitinophaga sp. 212800010-3]|uniref:RNA polymerase sigma factor n=1 Tax=unclassified Chitinophaga TaxID=2619133 RepID=UPI002DE7A93D|nr:RNA polymerase sigma factor, sigma-70 family [Chitinophaga sp. 212800010-3]
MKDRLIAENNVLWEQVIHGDQQAYRVLYEMYGDMLFRYGLRYMKDTAAIKDCIQDLFTDLYHYRRNLAVDVNIRYYLLGSFRRKLHQTIKKNTRVNPDAADDYFSIVYEPDPEQQRIAAENQQELLGRLARELNALPSRQKEVLFLKFNCDLSYDEVAGIMKISIPTCRTLAYRAFRQLRTNMEKVPLLPLIMLLMSVFAHRNS